ncbi:recombinase family protein [Desulfobotulus sp. H1]|uniref:Recombinase family protein n=1 Tax=Desulfobotulus pelophilus TaxID=2823377 RepID=A0ABT3N8F5_9BACT|nr:recombinase family protein [Desulfobotulus pelophilus]MCW7753733.1 recombinase family protein [Desulfobotulus pelophilus]
MNDFLKNLRSTHKDRMQGRGTHEASYPHPERRGGYDRRTPQSRKPSHLASTEVLQNISEALLGIHGLLQGLSDTAERIAEARERHADAEERKLSILEGLLPIAQDFFHVSAAPSAIFPEKTGSDTVGKVAREKGTEGEEPIVRKMSRAEKKHIITKIKDLRQEGATYEQIAEYLERNNVPTFSNKGKWHAQTIHRLCRTD